MDGRKVFSDSVHGHISLHPLLIRIIDTPQFQRLRNIKQLGTVYYVYPGASHNRFEHSLGTCHLAGQLLSAIKNKQPELDITDQDVLCVQIAALCHDLGHGPFSHMFDNIFMKKKNPNSDWKHERGSCDMLDYLIECNANVEQELKIYLGEERWKHDIKFAKQMIDSSSVEPGFIGRGTEKAFLYEIVSNEVNKVDVDKWDYFARDCHHLGIKNGFDHNRFIEFVKVLESPMTGKRHICARNKEASNLYEMFHTRNKLHRCACQHSVHNAIELMICEAMLLADNYVGVMHKNGKPIKISEAYKDMEAYTKLTDNIIETILDHKNDEASDKEKEDMEKAKSLLQRIKQRDIYRCVGEFDLDATKGKDKEIIKKEIAEFDEQKISPENLEIHVVKFDYGMQSKNPIDRFYFFDKGKDTPYYLKREDISRMLPVIYMESYFKVFCKDQSKVATAKSCFEKWVKEHKKDQRCFVTTQTD